MSLWVTRCDTVHLTEVLDVVERQGIAEEVEKRILKHATVSVAVKRC
jgi:hypothetical protein